MRYGRFGIALIILCYGLSCNWLIARRAGEGSKSGDLRVVLRPINALLHEDEHQMVPVLETRIASKTGTTSPFKGAQFVGEANGWARTNKSLYRTSDGGKTWEDLALTVADDAVISSFFFIDESRGWLAIVRQVYTQRYGLGNSSRIMVTEDGGHSWSEQASFSGEVILKDIRFLNAAEGLASGARVIDQPIDNGPPYDEIFVLNTSNGGKVWNDISESLKTPIKNENGMANDWGWSIDWTSASQILLLTKYGRVIRSTDQGKTWKTIAEFQDKRPHGFVSSTGFYKLLLDTEQRIRMIAGAKGDEGYWGDLVVNSDRGSWTSYELKRIPILDAVFLSDNEIVACGQEIRVADDERRSRLPAVGIILHSLDCGKTWSPIHRSDANETFISLTKVSDDQFYGVSDVGNFLMFTLKGK